MDLTALPNLAAYSIQVLCVAALGTLAALLFRVDAAGVRYAYWRAVLVLCLALPWLQGRSAHGPAAGASVEDGVTAVSVFASEAGSGGTQAGFDWLALVVPALAGGIALRLMWLGVGLMLLRRMRRAGQVAPPSKLFDEVRQSVGATAEIRYVPGLDQPVTFGARRPIVLLPEELRTHDADIQRAVLCHELLHVRRRDWVFVLVEEGVRAVLWFHPAIWWLVSRVQLTREEVVDQLTVLTTGRRRAYVEALRAFADDTPLAPAAAFARRRHLFRRMVLISKETVMSSRRIVLSCAAMALVVAVGSWSVVGAFPMTQDMVFQPATSGPGPLEQAAKPVSPDNPIPRRVSAADPVVPAEIEGRGAVTVAVTLDELGRVAESRPIGITLQLADGSSLGYQNADGPFDFAQFITKEYEPFLARSNRPSTDAGRVKGLADALLNSALEAVQQWRYDPPASAPLRFSVRLAYSPNGPVATTQAARIVDFYGFRGPAGGVRGGVSGGASGGVGGGVAGGVGGRARGGMASGSGTGVGTGTAAGGQAPLRVGGNIAPPTKSRDVRPVYPEDAKAARVQGVVIIEATVGPDGNVSDARVLRSIPMLDQAAVDAVMQWGFTPTLLNGQAVPVIMTVTVNFRLET
jgi:TonB family protein